MYRDRCFLSGKIETEWPEKAFNPFHPRCLLAATRVNLWNVGGAFSVCEKWKGRKVFVYRVLRVGERQVVRADSVGEL